MSDFDAAKKRLEEMDRANLFLNHGRAKHADACWRCDEPWPCLTMRVVIDADHEWAHWHDKWIAALDLMGSQSERAEKAEAELAAERERAESLRRLHDDHCSMGCGLTSGITEALRPAAPEAKESDCTCGEQWPCPLHGGPPAAPEPTPSEKCPYCGLTTCRYGADPTSTCHAKGDSCRCSEQPDLPLGHEFVPTSIASDRVWTDACAICGQPEAAHRRREP